MNPTIEKYKTIQEQAERLGIDYRIILDAQAEESEKNKEIFHFDEKIIDNLEIADWLWYFKNSNFVVTDSYHGFCFSIIFHKQFICFLNRLRGNSRFNSLSDLLDIGDFLIDGEKDIAIRKLEEKNIDYNKVEISLDEERHKSMKWLVNALEMPHKNLSADAILYEELFKLQKVIYKQEEKIECLNSKVLDNNCENGKKDSCSILNEIKTLSVKFKLYAKEYGFRQALKKSVEKIQNIVKGKDIV